SLWKVGPDTGCRYHLDELERLVTPKTRLIVVNTPHNPTGAMLSADELVRVYDLAESVGALVMCDEAYRWLTIPGGDNLAPRVLPPAGLQPRTFGDQRRHSLKALRIAWPPHRLDSRRQRYSGPVLGNARLRLAQPRKAQRCPGAPGRQAP